MQFCIKIEKSPLEDLCDHKSSSKHRTIIPFASEDRLGSYLYSKANGMVIRRLNQILRLQTHPLGDFLGFKVI